MKTFKVWLLAAGLLAAVPVVGQDAMMNYVKKLSARYPEATQRYEIRVSPTSNGRVRKETRYDLTIMRSQLTAAEQQQLLKLYQGEWQRRAVNNDKGVLYTNGDSVSCTIVYGLPNNNTTKINSNSLFSNKGFLMFDYGDRVSVKVSKVERYTASLSNPDFSAVQQCIDRFAERRDCKSVKVKYTGNDGFFIFQRGGGSGWTTGTRYTVRNAGADDFRQIREAFYSCADSRTGVELLAYNDWLILHNEMGKEIFVASRDKNGTIYLLRATEGEEPCVPGDWEHIDFFNNGKTSYVDVSRLDSLYESLNDRPDVVHTEVQYTGGWGDGSCPGFEWQRGTGKGWTRGTRLAISGCDEQMISRMRELFEYYSEKLPHVNLLDATAATTYEDGTRTFYGYRHQRDTLFFLRATTDGDICVPANWTTSTYYNNPQKGIGDHFPNASPATLRLLGLSRLWAEVKRNFVYYDKASVDWDSLYVATVPQVMNARSDDESNLIMQQMIARLHDGHTFVMGCDYGASLPICTRLIGGKVYVDGVYNDKIEQMGVRRGMEITKIDGINVQDYARQQLFPLVSSSTEQWTEHKVFDGSMLLTKRDGLQITLGLKDADVATEQTFRNLGSYQWQSYPQSDDLSFKVLDGNIGYLRIGSFNNSSVREAFKNVLPEILNTRALILDIRDNGGGNSGNGDYILSYLSNDSIRKGDWDSPLYCPALTSWGIPTDNHGGKNQYLQPAKDSPHYTNPIVTLINRGTFSAAEDFCSSLAWMKRGPLIGQPTGGSTGNGVRVELIPRTSYGASSANICSKHDLGADGSEFVGIGIQPTVLVEETWDSYFNSPLDNTVQAALNWLSREAGH